MRLTFVKLLVLADLVTASIVNLEKRACQANNCNRAVSGTAAKPPLASRMADCSSFLLRTVTPAVVTSSTTTTTVKPTTTTTVITVSTVDTVTSYTTTVVVPTTLTSTVSVVINLKRDDSLGDDSCRVPQVAGVIRRQTTHTATAVPAYASPCAGAAEYSSACSCWGITASTTTLTASTVTSTSISSSTSTSVSLSSTTTTSTVTTVSTSTSLSTALATTTTSVSAIPTCAPVGSCNVPGDPCAGGTCYCDPGVDGGAYCNSFDLACSTYDSYPPCAANSDCGANERCLTLNDCCSDHPPRCIGVYRPGPGGTCAGATNL